MDLFSHPYESTKANTTIYNEQKQRLSVNAWVILFCLLEGQELSAIDFVSGISFNGMNKKVMLCEYRRRLCELRDAGIDIVFVKLESGAKRHSIHFAKYNQYRTKYEPYKLELLNKINK